MASPIFGPPVTCRRRSGKHHWKSLAHRELLNWQAVYKSLSRQTLIFAQRNSAGVTLVSLLKLQHLMRHQLRITPESKVAFLTLGLFVAGVVSAESIRVTLLGSGGPEPNPDQFGPSTLVEAGEEKLIFDAGRGATIRLAQTKVPLSGITVFITHLHSDHLNGLSDIWTAGYMPPTLRQTPLEIFGPPGIVELAGGLQVAFKADIDIRTAELGGSDAGFSTKATTFDATEVSRDGVFFDRGGVTVSAISVEHIFVEALNPVSYSLLANEGESIYGH